MEIFISILESISIMANYEIEYATSLLSLILVDSDGETVTIPDLYVGAADDDEAFIGNGDKWTTLYFSNVPSWMSVTTSKKDDTANYIKLNVTANTTGTERSVNLKLNSTLCTGYINIYQGINITEEYYQQILLSPMILFNDPYNIKDPKVQIALCDQYGVSKQIITIQNFKNMNGYSLNNLFGDTHYEVGVFGIGDDRFDAIAYHNTEMYNRGWMFSGDNEYDLFFDVGEYCTNFNTDIMNVIDRDDCCRIEISFLGYNNNWAYIYSITSSVVCYVSDSEYNNGVRVRSSDTDCIFSSNMESHTTWGSSPLPIYLNFNRKNALLYGCICVALLITNIPGIVQEP